MDKIKEIFKKITTNDSVKSLVIKSIIFILIPYVYLFVCGIVFDMLLKWYFMTTFIFISLCVLVIGAIALIVYSIIQYNKAKKEQI